MYKCKIKNRSTYIMIICTCRTSSISLLLHTSLSGNAVNKWPLNALWTSNLLQANIGFCYLMVLMVLIIELSTRNCAGYGLRQIIGVNRVFWPKNFVLTLIIQPTNSITSTEWLLETIYFMAYLLIQKTWIIVTWFW